MSDLSPLCAPKQTSADFYGFMSSRATPQSKPRCPFRHPDVYEICEAQMPDFEVVN